MRRASGEHGFVWLPYGTGRHRTSTLAVVALCSALVGVAVGRGSSGASLGHLNTRSQSPKATKLDQVASAQTSRLVGNVNTRIGKPSQSLIPERTPELEARNSPVSPPVILLNPGPIKQADRLSPPPHEPSGKLFIAARTNSTAGEPPRVTLPRRRSSHQGPQASVPSDRLKRVQAPRLDASAADYAALWESMMRR